MKCFDLVAKVLDATYEKVPEKRNGSRDQSIKEAIAATAKQYGSVMDDGGPDFSDPATRFGYVFTYVPAHSHWVYELLDRSEFAKEIFSKGRARVTCVGGGPGSDVVGVLKYLENKGIECKLFAEIIDGCEDWKLTWSDMAYEIEWGGHLNTDYVIHDVATKSTWKSPTNIEKADVVILNFFVSEIFHLKNAKDYLTHLLSKVKDGAILLVNDNRTAEIYRLVDGIAKSLGFELEVGAFEDRRVYDRAEQKAALQKYMDKFDNMQPRFKANSFYRVFRKAA
jgi:hypothetical protein